MKNPISYYGGKQRIASQIVPYIWGIPHTVYAEPFFGGGSILYAKGKRHNRNGDHYREAINDKNQSLITFWKVARDQPDDLERYLRLTPYSQAEHKRAKTIYKNPLDFSELEVAWAVYIQCNMSFANQIGKGWQTATSGPNPAQTWKARKDRLPECFERLDDVNIGCEDAIDFIKRWDSPQTIFYCDPPYPGTDQGHYSGYSLEDYQALCHSLDNCQGSYILSNYAQAIAPDSVQKVIEIQAVMSASKDKTAEKERIEILYICDRSSGMRGDIAKIARTPNRLQQMSLLDL